MALFTPFIIYQSNIKSGLILGGQVISDEESEETDEVTPAVVSEQKDLIEEATWCKSHAVELKSIFENAMEQQVLVKDSERPLSLAQRALRNIQAIPIDSCDSDDSEMDRILGEIISLINKLRKRIKKK